jgi:hypothetical protein
VVVRAADFGTTGVHSDRGSVNDSCSVAAISDDHSTKSAGEEDRRTHVCDCLRLCRRLGYVTSVWILKDREVTRRRFKIDNLT